MTNIRLDNLAIPQPPYRMKRPVVKLASAESFPPANTPVLPPELMQELEASVIKPEPVPVPKPETVVPAPSPTPAEKAAMTREHTKALEEDAIRMQVKKEEEMKRATAAMPKGDFHEDFETTKESKEQEIHRLAKEALEKLNTYRSFAERNAGQGPTSPAEVLAKERAAAAQKELDAARKPEPVAPKTIPEEPKEVGSETVYIPAVKVPPAPVVETKFQRVETSKPEVEASIPPAKEEPKKSEEAQAKEREHLKKASEQEYESVIGVAHEEAQKIQSEQAHEEERKRMEAASPLEYRKMIDAAHEEANKERVGPAHDEANREQQNRVREEAEMETLEHPRTREEVAQLANHIDAMGNPASPGFWERLPGKSRAALDRFLAGVATALARRQIKKLSYREEKIADHMRKAQLAESHGLIFGTLSGTWHRLWASWHKKRGASAFEAQKHWHMVRGRYEDHRNTILEGISGQMERPLSVFRDQLEKLQKAVAELDRIMAANDKKMKQLDKDVQDPAKLPQRADILRRIQELADANMRMRRAKGDLVLQSGNAETKVIAQEGLIKRILQSTETPFPDTEPKEPSWLEPKKK